MLITYVFSGGGELLENYPMKLEVNTLVGGVFGSIDSVVSYHRACYADQWWIIYGEYWHEVTPFMVVFVVP